MNAPTRAFPSSLEADSLPAVAIDGRCLVVGGARRPVEPRVMALLRALADEPGEVLSRDDLLDLCWGAEGSDEALTQAVTQLRKALGDDPRAPRFVETIPKGGYRWLGEPVGAASRRSRLPDLGGAVSVPVSLILALAVGVSALVATTIVAVGAAMAPKPMLIKELHYLHNPRTAGAPVAATIPPAPN